MKFAKWCRVVFQSSPHSCFPHSFRCLVVMERGLGYLLIKRAAEQGLSLELIVQLEDGDLHELCDALGFPHDARTRQAIKHHVRLVAHAECVFSIPQCTKTFGHSYYDRDKQPLRCSDLAALPNARKSKRNDASCENSDAQAIGCEVQPMAVENVSDDDTIRTETASQLETKSSLPSSVALSERQNSHIFNETRRSSCALAPWHWFLHLSKRRSRRNKTPRLKKNDAFSCAGCIYGRHAVDGKP